MVVVPWVILFEWCEVEVNIRENLELQERSRLTEFAALSSESRGRSVTEEPCRVRTIFQHDRDRILHCKAFRRLKHKTQVFLSPEGDHYRTRLTHTLEVSQIARTVARALGLNEDLTEAIALGHDLGHTPFGHAGERVLNELTPGGFRHELQSLRVVERLEKEGRGLNLSWEVRNGIARHSKGQGEVLPKDTQMLPSTLEGCVVRVSDVIAYINHDLDDAIRAGVVSLAQVPKALRGTLGESHSQRIDVLVQDLIVASLQEGGATIRLSREMDQAMTALRDWLYENVYRSQRVHADFEKASNVLRELFAFFVRNPERLPDHGGAVSPTGQIEVSVADFVAGMTDRYALALFQELFIPQPWKTA